jgi:hypothetical protein
MYNMGNQYMGWGRGVLQDEGVEISELKLYGNLSVTEPLFIGNLLLNVGQTCCLQKTALKMEAAASHCIPEAAVLQKLFDNLISRSLRHLDVMCQVPMFCVLLQTCSLPVTQSVETSMSG